MNPSWPPFETLRPLLEVAFGEAQPVMTEIRGGASTRRFFRIQTEGGGRAVAMFVPPSSQEHRRAQATGQPWPFLEVRELLASKSIRVPDLLGAACSDGWLLLEDLGETLAQHLLRAPEDKPALYQRAVSDLARAQRSLGALPAESVVLQRAFDAELLRWELEHFREWALTARGIRLDAEQQAVFERASGYLASTIASWPRAFVHRDYQSRNLMVLPEESGHRGLAWIDFQDAMLGPRVYDLVALLGDSYQTFERGFIETRLDEFCSQLELDATDTATLRREFDLVTVQRKLKDAGRFVFIQQQSGDPTFLEFVEPALALAQEALTRLAQDPEMQRLAALLEQVLGRAPL